MLSPEVQQFIRNHEHADEKALVLKQKNILGIPSSIIAEQIAGRRKAKEKLPFLYYTPGILYPPALNLEQSSSEKTAQHKCAILKAAIVSHQEGSPEQRSGQGADLTGGFGIDTFFLCKCFKSFHYVEPNKTLFEIAKHNHQQLGADNINHHLTRAEDFLNQSDTYFDLIYIDPSRRTGNKKVFTFSQSEPDIVSLQEKIYQRTKHLLVKASPLLDIKLGLKELSFVKHVYVVAVENEVKELLFLCEKNFDQEPSIKTVNLTRTKEESFEFLFSEENTAATTFSDPLVYLYEPNAAILKAGAFKTTANRFGLNKMEASTHLYSSEKLRENFPGRIFQIEARVKPEPKALQQYLPEQKANILTRNYPLSVDELKKKTRLKDGGEKYLIGFSTPKEKFLVIASRIK